MSKKKREKKTKIFLIYFLKELFKINKNIIYTNKIMNKFINQVNVINDCQNTSDHLLIQVELNVIMEEVNIHNSVLINGKETDAVYKPLNWLILKISFVRNQS